MPNVHAVILAGGSGTRFWPASRRHLPKQLLPLAGREGEPLIAATVRRLEPLIAPEHVWIATGTLIAQATAVALPRVPRAQILVEPAARNTAAPIGWAAATIARRDPDALVAVLPADHYIADEPAFRKVLARALHAAEDGSLTTVGIVPTRPETGYGYIEVGDAMGEGVNAVARFVEKPDRVRAAAFLSGGKHLWNAGMFFFRARAMRQAIAEHLPALAAGLDRLDAAAARGDEASELVEVFPALPSVSIDHGVMEKASRLAVVPGSFGWNDVGSWEVAWELARHDVDGNALPEGSVTIDATNNLVKDLTTLTAGDAGKASKTSKRWALVGVHDLVVVETDDAVLVIPRQRAQDVRAVVDELTKRGEADKV
ncbi:MAG TPA: sugar phosphate nucleotidyltransferase [Polyangiaceae bacterium]|jgi:mannose-1-phosphate guanylyltransferase